MTRTVLLRSASLLSLSLVAANTYLLLWAPPRSASEIALFKWMQLVRFDAMGLTRTHWDFYRGLSLTFDFNFLLLAVLVWRLAGVAEARDGLAGQLIGTMFLGYALFAVVAWLYFFPAPAVLLSLAAGCLGGAYFGHRSR